MISDKDPIIDLALGAAMLGCNVTDVKEILTLLIDSLPGTLQELQRAYSRRDYEKLGNVVHKLHGGTCYSGTPRLRQASNDLETQLKANNHQAVPDSFDVLLSEIRLVLEAYRKL